LRESKAETGREKGTTTRAYGRERARERKQQDRVAFVAHTGFGSHSMTHHTLISSAPAFSSAPHASPSSSPTRSFSSAPAAVLVMSSSSSFAHHHGSLVSELPCVLLCATVVVVCEGTDERAAFCFRWRGKGACPR
jgi:hypothetical protein